MSGTVPSRPDHIALPSDARGSDALRQIALQKSQSDQIPWLAMPRRIDIELTSALADDSWTWRAAGAKKPNGVVNGSVLPAGSKVGDVLKVEMEQMLDGVEILSVVKGREKSERTNLLEILPTNEPFQEVIETRSSVAVTAAASPVATGIVRVAIRTIDPP